MNKKYLEFLIYFFATFSSLLIGVVVFNASIDYTGIFGSNLIPKEIVLKTDNRRLVTPGVIRKYKPDIIITGTSRAGRGLDPTHSIFNNQKTLNLFLNAGDADEIAQLLNFSSMVSPPKKIVLGLDFFSFDEDLDVDSYSDRFRAQNYHNNSLILRYIRNLDLLLSKDAIRANLSSLTTNKINFNEFSKKSFHDASPQQKEIILIDDIYAKAIQTYNLVQKDAVGHGYGNYRFANEKLNNLIQVLEKLKDQGVEIKLFMSPMHVYFLEAIFQLELFPEYSKIIIAMSKISEDPLIEFYDFSGFNEITTGRIGNQVSGNYPDAGHYSVNLGNKILETMFIYSVEDEGSFGKLVTSKNVEEHLNNFYKNRNIWRSAYAQDAKLIDNIVKLRDAKNYVNTIMVLVNEEFYKPSITNSNNENINEY